MFTCSIKFSFLLNFSSWKPLPLDLQFQMRRMEREPAPGPVVGSWGRWLTRSLFKAVNMKGATLKLVLV